MWRIIEHETKAAKIIDKAPKQVQRKYTIWKQLVAKDGPISVRQIKGYRDHSLKGSWEGYRSSSLNDQYRVIYAIHEKEVTVIVEQVGPHDY